VILIAGIKACPLMPDETLAGMEPEERAWNN
jgi:hypothetical protein